MSICTLLSRHSEANDYSCSTKRDPVNYGQNSEVPPNERGVISAQLLSAGVEKSYYNIILLQYYSLPF